jgi:hypothetical protein
MVLRDQDGDKMRTRRNVMAMGAMISTMMVASAIGANAAHAHHRDGHDNGNGNGNGHGGSGSCFLPGTHVLTDAGEVAIENLEVGARVLTVSGDLRTVRQIQSWKAVRAGGRRWSNDVAPIKVSCSALAPNVPHRDLFVSPNHALFIDGVLIRAGALVNGRTIVRCTNFESEALEYFHIELDDHQVILAEGAPVETLLAENMAAFAPSGIAYGQRAELVSRLRSAVSPWVDRRRVFDKVRDRLEVRAESSVAA